LPDIHFCPVRDREEAEVFAVLLSAIEDVPEFWALVLWLPFAEVVAV